MSAAAIQNSVLPLLQPASHVGVIVLELEAEKTEQLAVESLRAREIADTENEMVDTDDARHETSEPSEG